MSDLPLPGMPQQPTQGQQGSCQKRIRLERLLIQNFKAFDSLEINFPVPLMEADPDMFVIGSRNGLGKTSLLEACFLLFLGTLQLLSGTSSFDLNRDVQVDWFDLPDLLIRAGEKQAKLEGKFSFGQKTTTEVQVTVYRDGKVNVLGDPSFFQKIIPLDQNVSIRANDAVSHFASLLGGLKNDPLVISPYAYFHSYRKIQEGHFYLHQLVQCDTRPYHPPASAFKREIIQLFRGQGNMLEDLDQTEATLALEQLKNLMDKYVGGHIEKIHTLGEGKIEIPIVPKNGDPSFRFDSLSSGQKEIVSTLFLIWRYTKDQPSIVLIDEPELYLNAGWHRSIVYDLEKLLPHNQYILTSLSEDIAAAVDKERRMLIISKME
jgi:predicted ATP-dependent endonuclease of OLD family